ncbi:MAG: Lrp/AsnC family transcriptional regulator [Euryarchaeota archaeon]|nr:Lrp/AsnC family transcriptional regulator [Euryarchaeota archaeon]
MELDDLDVRILRILSEDARLSLREVARRLGSTAPTVSARLARLEESGIVSGHSVVIAPDRLPGRTRVVVGRVDPDRRPDFKAAVATTEGVLEGVVHPDGTFRLTLQVRDLDQEERCLAALTGAGARELGIHPAERLLGPGHASLFSDVAVVPEPCAICGRAVGEDPVEGRIDGRRVPFCCTSCRGLYLERYTRLKEKA